MGYMGFGMRKEVYTHKPRKPFTKLKELYKQELRKTHGTNSLESHKLSRSEQEQIKNRIRREIKKERQRTFVLTLIVLLTIIAAAWYFLYG